MLTTARRYLMWAKMDTVVQSLVSNRKMHVLTLTVKGRKGKPLVWLAKLLAGISKVHLMKDPRLSVSSVPCLYLAALHLCLLFGLLL
jgi:hypothetical protein